MNDVSPIKFGIGASAKRKEDKALITGAGRYVDDFNPEGVLRAYLLRSSMAHARFTLDIAPAQASPGVRLIWTVDELKGIGDQPAEELPRQPDGSHPWVPSRPLLARGVARHVGDPIALIVADDLDAAKSAAEAIAVDYEPLEAVVDAVAALEDGAPVVWPEKGSNQAFLKALGNKAKTDAAFQEAARVSSIEIINNRLIANYLETRGIVAEYDTGSGRWTLTIGTQGGHGIRDRTASMIGVDPAMIRVITPDVGGGFGTKIFCYAEYPLAALAARALGKPVKWISDRSEHFLVDTHGRDNFAAAEMAMDENGKFLAMRVTLVSNLGAYFSQFGASIAPGGVTMTTGVYDIPTMDVTVEGVFTNTVPIDAYRGAGRPEAAYLIERLVDACGRDTGLGPVEIRKRNYIPPEKLPYRTPGGRTYDSGEFAGHLDRALTVADYAGFPTRAADSTRQGKLRGFGFGSYVEACAFPSDEPAKVRLNADGSASIFIGTQSTGQGHATAYAQFVVARLGLDYDKVTLIQGDTDQVERGEGTGGSRSIPIGAVSVDRAATTLAEKIKKIASDELEAAASDLELADGRVTVAGTDRSLTLAEVAAAAKDAADLEAVENYRQPVPTYPNGTHAAEVEIDPDTGETKVLRYVIVDDFGVTVNPILLAGQVHGGVAQGIGQALLERTVYDESGQLLSASFLDYCIPRAEDVPTFEFETRNVPAKTNPLGVKGAGEAGTVGACGAVMNAVINALERGYGITSFDMPATPERVWNAIQEAKASKAA